LPVSFLCAGMRYVERNIILNSINCFMYHLQLLFTGNLVSVYSVYSNYQWLGLCMTLYLLLLSIFSVDSYSAELPQYVLVNEVLEESEIAQLQRVTEEVQPHLLWYGRYNFWRETFEAYVNDNAHNIIFTHLHEHHFNSVTDKLSTIFLKQ